MPDLAPHLHALVNELLRGKVVPFLGAGVNLCARPTRPETAPPTWWRQSQFLPNGGELAESLAQDFAYPDAQTRWDLMRVSQFIAIMEGTGPLYDKLQDLFARNYTPTPLHRLLARVPALLRERGYRCGLPLVVTTNYDEVLETAFHEEGEPFDLVSYLVEREGRRGKFWHLPNAHEHFASTRQPGAEIAAAPWELIDSPNTYARLPVGMRTVILKIHGAVDRAGAEQSSFVITEDDYIDYLARMDFANPLPKKLAELMRYSRFLFLGYGLRDWNLRVVLQRIWGEQKLVYRSWAIQLGAQEIDRRAWQGRNVDILDLRLEDYVPQLDQCIRDAPPASASTPA